MFDLLLAAGLGLAGYLLRKVECPAASLVLGFVLGPELEKTFRRAMTLSDGDMTIFVTQPISAIFLMIAVVFSGCAIWPMLRKRPEILATSE